MFKKRGFMDKLYFLNLSFAWLFTVACLLLNTFSGYLGVYDLSVVNGGLPVVWGELTVHTGFMIWKAKCENCRKYKDVNKLEELEREVEQ